MRGSVVLGKPVASFSLHGLHIKRLGRAAVEAFLNLLPERIEHERIEVARAVDDVERLRYGKSPASIRSRRTSTRSGWFIAST